MSNETADEKEQEKKKLVIQVLDKGLLELREVGVLASILGTPRPREVCSCNDICNGCREKCGGCHPQV